MPRRVSSRSSRRSPWMTSASSSTSTRKSSGCTPGRSALTTSLSSCSSMSTWGMKRALPKGPSCPCLCVPPPKNSRSMSSLSRRKSANGLAPRSAPYGSWPSRLESRPLLSVDSRPEPVLPRPCSVPVLPLEAPEVPAGCVPVVPPCAAASTPCLSFCAMSVCSLTGVLDPRSFRGGLDSSHAERSVRVPAVPMSAGRRANRNGAVTRSSERASSDPSARTEGPEPLPSSTRGSGGRGGRASTDPAFGLSSAGRTQTRGRRRPDARSERGPPAPRSPRRRGASAGLGRGGPGRRRLGRGDVADDRLLARLGPVGPLEEHHLAPNARAVLAPHPGVGAVRLQLGRRGVVLEADAQDLVQQPEPDDRILHRYHHLHPADEVAGHPVRGGEKHLGPLRRPEGEDSPVLQEPVGDGPDPDVLRDAEQARPEATDSADEEVDPHPRLGGGVQLADERRVHQVVHLGHDAPALAAPRPVRLAPDELGELLVEPEGRDHQPLKRRRDGVAGEHVEQRAHVVRHRRARGEERQVRVLPCGQRVVVARSEVDVAADALPSRRTTRAILQWVLRPM